MTRVASFVVLLAIIVVIGILFYRVMASFVLPLFMAGFLVVIFQPLHHRIQQRFPNRPQLAAGATTAAVMVIVLLPVALFVCFAIIEGVDLAGRVNAATVKARLVKLRESLGVEMHAADELRAVEVKFADLTTDLRSAETPDSLKSRLQALQIRVEMLQEKVAETPAIAAVDVTKLRDALAKMDDADELDLVAYQSQLQAADGVFRDIKYEILGGPYLGYFKELANPTDDQLHEFINKEASKIQPMLVSITGTTTTWFATQFFNATITILAVYFFLADGPRMVQTVMRLSPLDDRYEQELLDEFVSVSRAVVLATMLSAAAQGLLAGAGYWLAGLDAVFLLTVLTAVLAFVPFVGAFAVWGPVCVWLCFVEERPIAAIVFVVYGAAVISMADNVIKPYVLHGRSRLHPLLALLSVLGGVKALGPIGILVGPLIVAFLQTLLNILHRELTHFDREAAAES